MDSIEQLQGYKGGSAAGGVRQRDRAQPERARPVVPEREHLRRAYRSASPRTRLEFRLEVFNLLDRKIWGSPNSTITSANFGKVIDLANLPRQMQLGLRFEF